MIRQALQKLASQRLRFCSCVTRQGFKTYRSHTAPTLLLTPVWTIDGQFVAGHVWMNLTRALQNLQLRPGDWVAFDARVTAYWRGRKNQVESGLW